MNTEVSRNSRKGRLALYAALSATLLAALACLCGPLSNLPNVASNLAATPTLMSLDSGSTGGGSTGDTSSGGSTGGSTTGGGDNNGVLSFLSPDKANLKSFHSKFTMNYSGTKEDGTPVSGTFNEEEFRTLDPAASHMTWQGSGDAVASDKNNTADITQIGETTYVISEVDGAPKCTAMTASGLGNLASPVFSPETFTAGDMSKAQRVLPDEVVNGILSQHWQYNNTDVTLTQNWSNYTADIWTAVDGGYATKSIFKGDGTNISGAGGTGHIEAEFDLLEVNTDITISAPDGCEAPAGSDLPKMSDAADSIAIAGALSYTTASAPADVQAFYTDQMPAAGWTAGDVTNEGPAIQMTFTKGDQTATVLITGMGGKTQVVIQVK